MFVLAVGKGACVLLSPLHVQAAGGNQLTRHTVDTTTVVQWHGKRLQPELRVRTGLSSVVDVTQAFHFVQTQSERRSSAQSSKQHGVRMQHSRLLVVRGCMSHEWCICGYVDEQVEKWMMGERCSPAYMEGASSLTFILLQAYQKRELSQCRGSTVSKQREGWVVDDGEIVCAYKRLPERG
ncbi:unnamed protein product [Hydatigera taeniaeformis]|uniref:Secreted protein n=1 Tax=Hydatigena taeniaeformis TaxID=6205 RepID=A0A0R3WXL2_HYDTA|nr:unnamed protein product [Hydatigera taeniaeformis]